MSIATTPVPTISLAGCYIARKTAETLVDMALHRGLREEHDEAFLAWLNAAFRAELARRRAGELRGI